jgi:hypothetical protein
MTARIVRFLLAAVSALLFTAFFVPAQAAPFLLADAYPPTVTQPDSASFTVNGGAAIACTIETVTAGKRPKCDLASITTPGTYTLVLTATKAPSIVNAPNTATNDAGGSASSAPFAYVFKSGGVSLPSLTVTP